MSKQWRPNVDLSRLSAALAEEIIAATEPEVRNVSAVSGLSLAGAARDVRALIAAASDEQAETEIVFADAVCFRAFCARQH
jgi:hypothetical protein